MMATLRDKIAAEIAAYKAQITKLEGQLATFGPWLDQEVTKVKDELGDFVAKMEEYL